MTILLALLFAISPEVSRDGTAFPITNVVENHTLTVRMVTSPVVGDMPNRLTIWKKRGEAITRVARIGVPTAPLQELTYTPLGQFQEGDLLIVEYTPIILRVIGDDGVTVLTPLLWVEGGKDPQMIPGARIRFVERDVWWKRIFSRH